MLGAISADPLRASVANSLPGSKGSGGDSLATTIHEPAGLTVPGR